MLKVVNNQNLIISLFDINIFISNIHKIISPID